MNILKKAGKICVMILAGILALLILVIGGLNIVKLFLYHDYYAAESAVCKNPGLNDGFVCQGIAAADEADVILVSGYMKDDQPSRIYVTTLDNQSYHVTLHRDGEPFTGHAGGIAVAGGNVHVASGSKIYTFSLADVLNAENGGSVNIGQGTEVNNKASFLYSDDEYLYVGSFTRTESDRTAEHIFETSEGTHYAICSVYPTGDLSAPVRIYSIRDLVQGICFTPDGNIVMSTSYGLRDSAYYVYHLEDAVDSGLTLDGAPVYYLDQQKKEIKGPAMAEGLDWFHGKIITLTESASDKYIYGKLFFADDIVGLDFPMP